MLSSDRANDIHVVSASRRTDIPAFYSQWFMNRIESGYCHWLNPFNATQIYRVNLRPENVAAIVFWTRNMAPMLPHLKMLDERGYKYYVQYTITGYSRDFEPNTPNVDSAIDTFCRVADAIGPDRVIWRYDPIVLSTHTDAAYHLEQFEGLAGRLEGHATDAYFSFCDMYGRTEKRLSVMAEALEVQFWAGSLFEHAAMARQLAQIAASHKMRLSSCAEAALDIPEVRFGHCIDPEIIALLRPDLDLGLKPAPTREGCGCVQAQDIGAADTCVHGCNYCYATSSIKAAKNRRTEHDPSDSFLWRPSSLTDEMVAKYEDYPKSVKIRPKGPEQLSMLGDAAVDGLGDGSHS